QKDKLQQVDRQKLVFLPMFFRAIITH
ncbi:MAG: hypothetical protein ACJAV1_003433, partial [Paraglaciecola sp.]